MNHRSVKAAVFDLDGTLADTSKDLIAAANACFLEMGEGKPMLDPEGDQLVAFHGARAMLSCGIERMDPTLDRDALAEKYYALFLDKYRANIDRHTQLYPGAVDALNDLRDRGWRLCVCTNKPERLALKLLERLEVLDMFLAVVGGDTYTMRKPDPMVYELTTSLAGVPVPRSFMVGDTKYDLQTARNAGVAAVLVGFGPLGGAISALEPDVVLDSYDKLAEISESIVDGFEPRN
ncbi:MAG: HAD-IA family hydrolase [Rhodobacteraceae bacterium]|nr:HAD-IA family hydrolase [Paracoccaceae bacterium]